MDEAVQELDVTFRSICPRSREDASCGGSVCLAGRSHHVEKDERPLPLHQVPTDLLAISSLVRQQVEEIVLDLEGDPEGGGELPDEREPCGVGSADEGPDLHRSDERVPAGLLVRHDAVVAIAELPDR